MYISKITVPMNLWHDIFKRIRQYDNTIDQQHWEFNRSQNTWVDILENKLNERGSVNQWR